MAMMALGKRGGLDFSWGWGGTCPCPGLSSELLPCLWVLLQGKLYRHGPLSARGGR